MIRRIIQIDEEKCNGCGLCAEACHEGAIGIVDGKAKLLRDDYCDGLGDCLPTCPAGAITFVEREALAYDEAAVKENIKKKQQMKSVVEKGKSDEEGYKSENQLVFHGCPGSRMRQMNRNAETIQEAAAACDGGSVKSQLRQWPVQIQLAPVKAPYFAGANLLIAADCTAYAYGNFHQEFIRNRITLIGCPKLDEGDYTEKLTEIISRNDIKSLTIVRMEVPCCGGLEHAAVNALKKSGKFIPWQVVTISLDGEILNQ